MAKAKVEEPTAELETVKDEAEVVEAQATAEEPVEEPTKEVEIETEPAGSEIEVKAVKCFTDLEAKADRKPGDKWLVAPERAALLIERGLVVVL